MTAGTSPLPRSYRFERLDRSGVVLGLGWGGLAVVAGGLVVTVMLLAAQANLWLTFSVGASVGLVAYAPVGPISILEWFRVVGSWVARTVSCSRSWMVPVSLLDPNSLASDRTLKLPPCLDGLSIVETTAGVGAVLDLRAGTRTALVAVSGSGFLLVSEETQEALLDAWGSVIAGFATEHSVVARLSWSSFVAPGGDHLAWLADQPGAVDEGRASVAYREMVSAATAVATQPEVIVAVTVTESARRQRRGGVDADPLAQAVAALTRGLDQAGLTAGPPMSPVQIATALRVRVDPSAVSRTSGGGGDGSLAARLGLVSAGMAGPMAVAAEWDVARIDGAWHRTYWVMDWPRSPQGASWLEPLVASSAMARREVTVIMEPSSPSKARARLDRAIRRRGTDEVAREDAGQRTTAAHRQAQRELLEREAELVGGHAEVGFVGLVRVTADSRNDLDDACLAVEQQARERGVALRVLFARQDAAFAASLPLGIGVSRVIQ